MTLLGCVLVVVLFAWLIHWFGLVPRSKEVIQLSTNALDIVRDSGLHDDEKETRLQKHSLRLLFLFVILFGGSVAALLIPIFAIWLLQLMGLVSLDQVLATLMRWEFIAGTTLLAIIVYFVMKRRKA